uniref:Uncharacterized protein n=1 Tax=Knipowitschia caucasica TaxID=637954 RepID=A0AAV2M702_KNICA
MTCWPRNHPVLFPHLRTDHWTKMKTMVPDYMTSMPSDFLKRTAEGDKSTLPSLTTDRDYEPEIILSHYATQTRPNTSSPIYSMSQYRNAYNDRARLGFCYWLIEKKAPKRKGYSFGAYKTYNN